MMSRCEACRRDLLLVGDRWLHVDREGLERHVAEPGRVTIGAPPRVDPDHERAPHPAPVEPAHPVPVSSLPRLSLAMARKAAGGDLMRPRGEVWSCRVRRAVGYATVGHVSREEYRLVEALVAVWERPGRGSAVGCWVDGAFRWGIVVQPDHRVTWRAVRSTQLKEHLCAS